MMKLEFGHCANFELREVEYVSADVGGSFSVLYLSDLHLTRLGGSLVDQLLATITQLDPQVVLLGGDYVDSCRGMTHFGRLLQFLAGRPHVFVVAGNHDVWFGLKRIRQLVEANNLVWLTDKVVEIKLAGRRIQLSGRATSNRAPGVSFSIVCLHEPVGLREVTAHNLVFAGHLHGGQIVLWRSAQGLYPGRLFYRWNILQAWLGQCLVVVSKGLGDTLPVRYNCPRDVVLVSVRPASI